jgi:hypothetical protein
MKMAADQGYGMTQYACGTFVKHGMDFAGTASFIEMVANRENPDQWPKTISLNLPWNSVRTIFRGCDLSGWRHEKAI